MPLMVADFVTVAITPPEPLDDEPRRIAQLLDAGVDRVHIRHPRISREEMSSILATISPSYRSHISIHDHISIALEFEGVGVHLGSRNPEWTHDVRPPKLSRSMHSIAELANAGEYDYVTLSPIYDSISKQGYSSAFALGSSLGEAISGHNVVALGGVTPEKFDELKQCGFVGAAMLGWVWQNDLKTIEEKLKR